MKMNGYVLNKDYRGYIPMKNLKTALDYIEGKTGVFFIENSEAQAEIEPENLTLYFDNGRYLLMLLDYDDEGYIDIRTPYNPSKGQEMEEMLGELYGANTIITDFTTVRKAFIEFEKTGNVSKKLLV